MSHLTFNSGEISSGSGCPCGDINSLGSNCHYCERDKVAKNGHPKSPKWQEPIRISDCQELVSRTSSLQS